MNKLFTLLLILACTFTMNAQNEFPATSIIEHFTNTKCGNCGSANPGFYTILNRVDNYLHIAYHPKYPYNSCIFYQANKTGNMVKTDFYGISGTPSGVINGIVSKSIRNISLSDFNDNHESMSTVSVEITPEDGDNIGIEVINNDFEKDDTEFKLFAMMVEDPVNYDAPNGEKIHHNVFRSWLTSESGEALSLKNERIIVPISYVNVQHNSNAKVVAYVQDMISKKIYNATESTTLTSIKEQLLGVKIFPSHTESTVTIETEVAVELLVYQLSGTQLMNKFFSAGSHTLDLSELNSGIYFINLSDQNGKSTTKKVIVQ